MMDGWMDTLPPTYNCLSLRLLCLLPSSPENVPLFLSFSFLSVQLVRRALGPQYSLGFCGFHILSSSLRRVSDIPQTLPSRMLTL